jgi:hypothetical protein
MSAGTNVLRIATADQSGYVNLQTQGIALQGSINAPSYPWLSAGGPPTIASGFGTTPSIAHYNGWNVFVVNVGTGGTASSGVINTPNFGAGSVWVALCNDMTAAAGVTGLQTVQTAYTAGTITIQSQKAGVVTPWAASSLVAVIVMGCV